jgi:hypothetical protein
MRLVAEEHNNIADPPTILSWREEMETFHADYAANVHKANLFEEPLLGMHALNYSFLTQYPAHVVVRHYRT